MRKIAIVGCSNGRKRSYEDKLNNLKNILIDMGLEPICSDCLFEIEDVFSGTSLERANVLMEMYENNKITHIFDISGGDLANGILPYLDYEIIKNSDATFWGYSDLTTLINAIYTKTNKQSILYQIRNLVNQEQIEMFKNSVIDNKKDLFKFEYEFIQGNHMEGIVLGGNIRCLLKLAGTEYWPDFTNKILLLESLSGRVAKMETYLCQLQQLGVFNQINGILLGTFTEMEENKCKPDIVDLVMGIVGIDIPIVRTSEIGHGIDSKAIVIGKEYSFRER